MIGKRVVSRFVPAAGLGSYLRKNGRFLAQWLWFGVALLSTLFFLASLPPYRAQLLVLSPHYIQSPDAIRSGLNQLGLSTGFLANIFITTALLIFVGFAGAGLLIFWRKR